MVDDSSAEFVPRMHPDDLAELKQGQIDLARSLMEASARVPAVLPPNRPPVDLDGRDARIFRQAAQVAVEEAIRNLLTKDQIEQLVIKLIADKTGRFLTKDEIETLALNVNVKQLNRIGLRADEDHIEETGEIVRKNLRWSRQLDRVFGGIVATGLGAVVIKLLGLIGVNVPWVGGGGH